MSLKLLIFMIAHKQEFKRVYEEYFIAKNYDQPEWDKIRRKVYLAIPELTNKAWPRVHEILKSGEWYAQIQAHERAKRSSGPSD